MFWSIVGFEIRHHLRNPLLYITSGVMFLLCFGAVTSDTIQVGGSIGHVYRNAPIVVLRLLTTMSAIGLFIVTAFVASSIHRDFELGTHELFFSRPAGKLRILGGRFVGSMAVSLAVFLGPALGIVCGSYMPWVDPERLGPFMLAPYAWTMAVMVVPNVLFMGATFFTLAGITRSMMATYLGVVGTFVGYGISQAFLRDLESQAYAAFLDPFGISPLRVATKYWTVVERNTALPELSGYLLYNRLLWVGLGLAVLALGIWWFDPARSSATSRRTRRRAGTADLGIDRPVAPAGAGSPPRPALAFGVAGHARMLLHATRLEVTTVMKSAPFVVMLAFGVINVLAATRFVERMFGTKVLPVTHLMLQELQGSYLFLLVIIVTFYAGETIWRERTLRVAEVHDALPAPTWVFISSKLAALLAVVLAFTGVGAASTIGYQLFLGYNRIEPGVYAAGLLLAVIPFALMSVLAVMVQVLARSKFLGYLVMIVFLLSDDAYDALHMNHHLYRFPFLPDLPYSDMNGWGHLLEPYLWFAAYWGLLCVVMLVLCGLFWVRGADTSWRFRWQLARQRFTTPSRTVIAVGLSGFLASGAFIFYNTNIVNEYLPQDKVEARQVEYEKLYRRHKDLPQPRITDVYADVDIYPDDRRVEIRGRYRLHNKTPQAIDALHLSIPPEVEINRLGLPNHTVTANDERLSYRVFTLAEPLHPDDTMELEFDLTVTNPGFVNNDPSPLVVRNGTFFSNRHYFPVLGYNPDYELEDRNARRKHGLPPDRRMAEVDDPIARLGNDLGDDADWIGFATTVSTSPDQIAIAPGYLQREWVEGDRRYFRYAMDAPILNFFNYISGEYEVKRDRWNDVAIEVYHHATHDTNIDRMIDSVKKTLGYCTANFGPYQHHQVRIIEFPRYQSFAQSFPNTIPYSESIGFIARIDDEEDIDTVFYVTAHEVAHQWWGHQVVGANVQGASMISEALSQYTALSVMEQEYGHDKMRRFLKYELDRYLSGRGNELVEEMPLMLVERQPYIYYRKGSVVMYALRDYLGADAVNRALAAYVQATAFQEAPYTNSLELLAMLKNEAPEGCAAVFTDMLASITLFSNRVERATWTRNDDGRYVVRLEVAAKKLRADGHGTETEIEIDDWIDVGIFGTRLVNGKEQDAVLFMEKRHITGPDATFEIVVDGRPLRAGIDPYSKLIDRDSGDNVVSVREG